MNQGRTWGDGALSSALLLFLTATGLAVAYLPFSGASRTAVLAHVVVGLVALPPLLSYLLRHARAYWEHPLTHYKVTGWVGLAVLALRVQRTGGGATLRAFGRHLAAGSAILGIGWGAWGLFERSPTWDNSFPEGYGMPHGEDRPFAPSLATTESGGTMDPRSRAPRGAASKAAMCRSTRSGNRRPTDMPRWIPVSRSSRRPTSRATPPT